MLSIGSEPTSKILVFGPANEILVLFRIISGFRILRLTFHRKSASKY